MTTTHGNPDASSLNAESMAAPKGLGEDVELQLGRLVHLRRQLVAERERSVSPAVARAIEISEDYLFLALTYLGYVDELFPGDDASAAPSGEFLGEQ